MRFGVTIFATDRSIGVVELAKAVEDRGFHSLWVPEHTHIPLSRRTPPPTGEPELGEQYRRCLDPLVALTAAGSVTSSLRVGTGISLIAQRDPIVTAKAIASLDLVTCGRFSLGIGYGWNEDEMESHGVDPRRRRALVREHVLAMRRLWEDDVACFDGELVNIAPAWSWPKPVQRPLPVLIGGAAGPTLFAHIAEFAQGWMPIGGAGLGAAIPRLRAVMEEAGRDADELEIAPFGTRPSAGKLDHFESIGVTECIFQLPSAPRDDVLVVLDEQAALIASRN